MGWKPGKSKCSSRPEQQSPPQRSRTGSHRSLAAQAAANTGCRELVALCPSPAPHLHPLKPQPPSQRAGSVPSAATWHAAARMRTRTRTRPPSVTATLPGLRHGGRLAAPREGTGRFPAFRGASFGVFNYICGLNRFAWPLKSISQRVVLKRARNICGGCGFPPGLQEE